MTTTRIEALLQLLGQDPSDGTSHYMLGDGGLCRVLVDFVRCSGLSSTQPLFSS